MKSESAFAKDNLYIRDTTNHFFAYICGMKSSFITFAYIIPLWISMISLQIRAEETPAKRQDSIRISLLTCAAGEEIYSLFGHTAIRYENKAKGIDVVYNYGVFDFDTPLFAFRFALGETDYQLARNDFRHFALGYASEGRKVWQQVLDLTDTEKRRLIDLLEINYRPENRIYRYNFFYDNCATRPRDQIERATEGRVQYAEDMQTTDTGVTFRHLLHRYSKGHPWSRFSMDLCMGSHADEPITRRTMQFVPFNLQTSFGQATITDTTGHSRALVKETVVLQPMAAPQLSEGGITPLQCAVLLWVTITLLTTYGLWKKKSLWYIDLLLFGCAGIAGCIPTFLALFSQHPAVSPNYLLFILHPFHLLCLPWMLKRVCKRKRSVYMMANTAVLILFIASWSLIPQHLPLPILFVALCLLERSMSNLIISKPSQTRLTTIRP